MRVLYVGLFGLTFASAGLFLAHHFRGEGLWLDFVAGYLMVLVVYTLWLFALLFKHDVRPRRYPRYGGEKIGVVVPCFNEAPELLERSLRSVASAAGRKQIVVVDDGSTNGVQPRLRELALELGLTLHEFRSNAGKREALHYAVTQLLDDDVEFVVTIDSDTVLDRAALVRVVEPLLDERIGAATGDVRLLNERQNVLTRMVGTYYWIGLNIYKQAQSVISSVVCCSGCLAAYRASLMGSLVGDLTAQRFLGEPCTHSEDRHLTNLVLKQGLDVVYVPEAISWTETPATLRSFVRQQRRWKRGYIRESLFTVTHAWRTKPILWLQVVCWDLTAPFLSFGLRLALIATAVQRPQLVFTVVLPSWVALMLVRYIFVPLRAWRKLPGLFLYMLFYECCLYWLSLWALVTVKNRSWVTRVDDRQATATVF
jgi:hyaluronan synthase